MILLHIINKKHLAFNEVKLTPLKINSYFTVERKDHLFK